MKCYVCGTNIGKAEEYCPCCKECVVDIIGDSTETEKILKDKGEKRRNKLLSQYEIYVAVYKWEGKSQEIRIAIGSAKDLFHKEKWLEERFARIPDIHMMELKLVIMKDGKENVSSVKVESFQSPTLLHIGAVIEDGFQLKIILKNDRNETHTSEAIDLLMI